MTPADDFYQKRRFIIQLGKALHKLGSTAYRLEDNLLSIAHFLDIRASFMVTPTALTFILSDEEDEHQYNHLVRVAPGEIDLGSLARIDELVDELTSGERTLDEAIERLKEVNSKSPPYGFLLTFLAFGASSGAFAMLMHTSWHDVFWSTILGFIVFSFVMWAERSRRVTEMLEPMAALTTSLLASLISIFDPSINIPMVILSSIISFIPGLSLTVGLSELAARHLMSGTARIMDGAMVLFKLYFGAVLGMALGNLMWGEVTFIPPETMPVWTSWLAVTTLTISLVILFKVRLKDAPWGMIAGYISFGVSIWATSYLGVALGAFVGAFALGIYSNLFSRIMNLPSSIVRLLGLVVLVPGSKVYIGLNSLVSGKQMLDVADLGSQTFLIFMSLVAGIIFSNVAIPHRKTL
ncbi:threonine/serine ThrE exporter family protein [Colwellia sp. 20A7]|uniref:threonine/serine ThrE exporter family protein n=1 Tax=Colwellia sp. 20A7 TaxID=2689569 RepID=UPI00135B1D5B|nr:threonine/serine exporter family protein [Colwellia sp. 20A7]